MSEEPKNKKAMALAFAIGFELIAMELAGIFLGHYIGGQFQQPEIGAILGAALGFTVWIWRLVQTKRFIS